METTEDILAKLGRLDPETLKQIHKDAQVKEAQKVLAENGIAATPSTEGWEALPPKQGIKTSEGWLSYIISILGGFLAAWGASKGNELITMIGSVLAGGTTVGYTFARTKAKQ